MTTVTLNSSEVSSFEMYREDFVSCPSCGCDVSSVSSHDHHTVEILRPCRHFYRMVTEQVIPMKLSDGQLPVSNIKEYEELIAGCHSSLLKVDCIVFFNPETDNKDDYLDLKRKAREQLQHNWSLAVDSYIDAKREEFAKHVPVANKEKSGGKRL